MMDPITNAKPTTISITTTFLSTSKIFPISRIFPSMNNDTPDANIFCRRFVSILSDSITNYKTFFTWFSIRFKPSNFINSLLHRYWITLLVAIAYIQLCIDEVSYHSWWPYLFLDVPKSQIFEARKNKPL